MFNDVLYITCEQEFMAFKFEKLIVWQKAVDLAGDIHELTRSFPKDELFVLTSQIKRATDSISLNIAEGSTGQSNAEFKKFLGYAIRSDIEVVGCLYLAKKRDLIKAPLFDKLYAQCEEILVMLNGLRNSLN
ncbi:four helix bundle protein [Mucilaginibacter sp. UYCu711]